MKGPFAVIRTFLRLPRRLGELEQRFQKMTRSAERKTDGFRKEAGRLKKELKVLRKAVQSCNARNARQNERLEETARRQVKRVSRLMRRTEQINSGQSFNSSYAHLGYRPKINSGFNSHEFSVYSQNGEDGLLLHIFDTIGMATRRFIEISPADAIECNSMNLVANFGWSGLMVDGSDANMESARALLDTVLGDESGRVDTKAAFVTAENVTDLIAAAGLSGEIDLLSIDVDGNDYWLWRAVQGVSPRVVVIEYNELLGSEAVTVPYDPRFRRRGGGLPSAYYGASLTALQRLGRSKGYSLVGSDSSATNLFFVRSELMTRPLTEQPPEALIGGAVRRYLARPEPGELSVLPLVRIGKDGEPCAASEKDAGT